MLKKNHNFISSIVFLSCTEFSYWSRDSMHCCYLLFFALPALYSLMFLSTFNWTLSLNSFLYPNMNSTSMTTKRGAMMKAWKRLSSKAGDLPSHTWSGDRYVYMFKRV